MSENDPIKRTIETVNGKQYAIEEFISVPQIIGRGFVIRVAPHSELNAIQITDVTAQSFRFHFSPNYKIDEGMFGFGEDGFKNFILDILKMNLDKNPEEDLKLNKDGQYEINFE